jgi:hypothetical protein
VFTALTTVYIYNVMHEGELNWTLCVLEAAPALKSFYIKVHIVLLLIQVI